MSLLVDRFDGPFDEEDLQMVVKRPSVVAATLRNESPLDLWELCKKLLKIVISNNYGWINIRLAVGQIPWAWAGAAVGRRVATFAGLEGEGPIFSVDRKTDPHIVCMSPGAPHWEARQEGIRCKSGAVPQR